MSLSQHDFDQLIATLAEIPTSTIFDAMDTLGIAQAILDLQPMVAGRRFAGPAMTVKEVTAPKGTFRWDELRLERLIQRSHPGQVIVIDNGGSQVSTWGGVISTAAQQAGLAAAVVDGGVRDVDRMRALGFPVHARYAVPISPTTRVKIEAMDVPVSCGGVTVESGDVIAGDDTGLVVIPSARLGEVVERVREIHRLKIERGIFRFDVEGKMWE